MNEPTPKTEALYVRVTPDTKHQLVVKATEYKMHSSDLVRELVTAFIEGRVTVAPPAHVKEFYSES